MSWQLSSKSTLQRAANILSVLLLCATFMPAQVLRGVVLDSTGAAVAGAEITVGSSAGTARTLSSADGHFGIDNVTPPATVSVRSAGFTAQTSTWSGNGEIKIVMRPEPVQQQVVVTATRTEAALGEVSASVSRISAEELRAAPELMLDQVLRQVPGFSLFRRSDSRTANPTSQGVSLRGLGASGASRALVLYDGVSLNDPFGGWVYWDRVPMSAIRSIEVLRGGGSALYGSGALAGVVNIVPQDADARAVSFESSAGGQGTRSADVTFSERAGAWGIGGTLEAMRTDGYVPVPRELRGRADAAANLRYGTSRLSINRHFGDTTVFVSGNLFNESRQNGTVLQTNSTRVAEGIAGMDASAGGGRLAVRIYGSGQRFNQTFSAIAPDRNTETLVRVQAVPAQQLGGSAQWVRPIAPNNVLAIGGDLRQVRGQSDEVLWSQSAPSSRVIAGGRQLWAGVFAEDMLRIGSRLHITGALRADTGRNYDARIATTPLVAGVSGGQRRFDDRTATALSPSAGAAFQLTRLVAVTGSAYGAFRSPTLNELYRAFRLGNVQTVANDALRAERLRGMETGLNVGSGAFFGRATLFWNSIHDAVGNRTLSITPALITRQRQNIGVLQARGVELELQAQLPARLWMRAGYEYSRSTVSRSQDAALVGLRIPQVPRHAASAELGYRGKRWGATLAGRYVGRQFDDDLNQFVLPGYFSADASLRYHIAEFLEAFVSGENLLDRDYLIGRTPVPTLGSPRFIRAGVRLRWSRVPPQ
jgi:outer membrane receptor protein involved in Fe transport